MLDAYHDLMADIIYEQDIMQDYGFITLSVKNVPARVRSDPRDNSIKINLEPSHKIVIKAGKSLKDILDIIDDNPNNINNEGNTNE